MNTIHHIASRYVTPEEKPLWYSLDRHLPVAEFDKKVRDRQGYVLSVDGKPAGILCYNLFWDNTPFCTLLFIEEKHRRHNLGRELMEHWEHDMRSQGYDMVLTSTQVDEDAQHSTADSDIRTVEGSQWIFRATNSRWSCLW